jgi:1-phosphofructokinase
VTTISRGEVHRATSELIEPSGKGVNVSITLHAAGQDTVAVLPAGGYVGRHLTELLAGRGVPVRTVPVSGDVRSNVSVVEADGTTTKFNAPGAALSGMDVTALVTAAADASAPGQWVAWCGSLPAGFPVTTLADAVAAGRASGRLLALDSSGSALAAVLRGPAEALPHLIKPNAEELSELVGRPLRTVGAVGAAARDLVAAGVRTVLVSLGGDGAVLVQADAAYYGQATASRLANTAGAGDAFLAGYLAAIDQPAPERLQSALRFGAAAVAQSGTLLIDPPTGPAAPGSVFVQDIDAHQDRVIS